MKLVLLLVFFVLSTSASASQASSDLKAEGDLIASIPKKKVRRDKGLLVVTLKNGKKKSYKDNLIEGSESFIRHSAADYIAKHGTLVIQQQFYEGGQFLVVSLKDGSEIITPTKPIWSLEKNNFISVNDDESDYTDNITVIGTCKAMKCKKVFSEKAHAGAEKWIDDKTVEYEHRKFDPGTGAGEVKTLTCKIDKKVNCLEKK